MSPNLSSRLRPWEISPQPRVLSFVVRLSERLPRPYAGYLRAVSVRLLAGKEFYAVTPWGTHVCPATDHTFLASHFKEQTEVRLLANLVKPGMTFIDVGANRGWYTLMASSMVGTEGTVVAVEPDQRARALLLRTLAANPSGTNVTVVPKAMAAETGTMPFVAPPEGALSHLLGAHEETQDAGTIEIDTLDGIASELKLQSVHVVKIDVEGAEIGCLLGMRHVLDRDQPVLLIEAEREHLARHGNEPADIPRSLGEAYECFHICWQHDRLEPMESACDSGRNFLCLPVGYQGGPL